MTAESDEPADRYVTDNHFSGVAQGPIIQAGQIAAPLTIHMRSATMVADQLTEVAEQLALAVGTRWRREEELHQVQDPIPLPVRWQHAPERLTDDWTNICRVPAGESADPIPLTGDVTKIVAVHRRIPSGRLVVLGKAGSGKTILAIRFVLGSLENRTPADPIPVIVNVGSWNPVAVSLERWLISQLIRDHPGLAAAGPSGSTLAAALVSAGRILPVLDGFDEIADGLHRPALRELNTTTRPLVVTSRPTEYTTAVKGTDVLSAAAAIELVDLTLADLGDYLPRTTRRTTVTEDGATTRNVWDRVLDDLRDHPKEPACAQLTAVLTTPLMVALARANYSDTPDEDPTTLLDMGRFPTPHALEEHLIGGFMSTAYRSTSAVPGRRQWDAERARQWLGYLARHLNRLGKRDLAWWQLGDNLSTLARMVTVGVAVGVCFGLMVWLYYSILNCVVTGSRSIFFWLYEFSISSLVAGVAAGLAFGLALGLVLFIRPSGIEPVTVQWRFFHRTRQPHRGRRVLAMVVVGFVGGVAFGLANQLIFSLVGLVGLGQPIQIRLALFAALVTGPAIALVALATWFEAPLDVRSAVRPADLLRTNRKAAISQALCIAPMLGLATALNGWVVADLLGRYLLGSIEWNLSGAVGWAVSATLGGGLGYVLSLTAWGHWFLRVRIWLPLTGRLPWAVLAFLDDAHERGVLRHAGAVYQFRHDRLKDHLARTVSVPVPGADAAAT